MLPNKIITHFALSPHFIPPGADAYENNNLSPNDRN